MIQILLLALLLASPAEAGTWFKSWYFTDVSAVGTHQIGCRLDQMSDSRSTTDNLCKVPENHTLHITQFGAIIDVATSIEDVDFSIFDGSTKVADSLIEFGVTTTCDSDNLGGTAFDIAGEYCLENVDITITEGTVWYIDIDDPGAGGNDLQTVVIWLRGTMLDSTETAPTGVETANRFIIVAGTLVDGDLSSPCDLENSHTFPGQLCRTPVDIKVISIGMAPYGFVTGAFECGRVSLQVNGVNQSVFDIYFGETTFQAVSPTGDCILTEGGDLDGPGESCVTRGNVTVSAGQSYGWVALDNPTPCSTPLSEINTAVVSLEIELP